MREKMTYRAVEGTVERVTYRKIDKNQCIDTGMAMVLLSLVAYFSTRRGTFVPVATAVLVVNMTAPRLFQPAAFVWLSFSHLIGAVMSRILLFIVYFVVVTPTALLRRAAGRDTLLLRKFKGGEESVMVDRNHKYSGRELVRPY
jgi:hypothetical protein